jgi:hypothetical protein
VLQLRLEDHAMKQMVDSMVSVCLNTDNRLVSNTTMSKEIAMAVRAFGLSAKQLRDIVVCGIKRSFFAGPYVDATTLCADLYLLACRCLIASPSVICPFWCERIRELTI